MDWDKLRIFHAVAKAGSFTRAGEELNLTQSVVSRHIATLENSLNISLFHRNSRGLVLTEQGELLYGTTQDIFHKLSVMEGEITDSWNKAEGPLLVSVSDYIGSTWLSKLIKPFREQHPDIQLTFLFEDRILNLNMREADVAIKLTKPTQSNLIQRTICTVHFHLCAHKDYLERFGYPESVEDLKNHTILAFPKNIPGTLQEPDWLIRHIDFPDNRAPNLVMMNSMYAIGRAIKSAAGIGILADYQIAEDPHIEILLPEFTRPAADMYFVYSPERKKSERIKIFRDFLLKNIDKTQF